jgi:hypothetical protein
MHYLIICFIYERKKNYVHIYVYHSYLKIFELGQSMVLFINIVYINAQYY